jgi:oligopeptide/dipeptide ABC transporter ATP-binding protein
MRLVDDPGKIVDGTITFDRKDLMSLSRAEMVRMRGNRMSMIFQQPKRNLNPVIPIGKQISEVFRVHRGLPDDEALESAIELFRIVGIPDPEIRVNAYPHELSGGQAQRVMIAMALALNPRLLIADEPTTALDVTIQAQILDLMSELRNEFNTAVVLITHDLGVIAEMADRVAVMYAGQIVEETDVKRIFDNPLHPYTQGLLASIPILGKDQQELDVIPGTVPNLIDLHPSCRFAPRCRDRVMHDLTICTEKIPCLKKIEDGHLVRCWLYDDEIGLGSK